MQRSAAQSQRPSSSAALVSVLQQPAGGPSTRETKMRSTLKNATVRSTLRGLVTLGLMAAVSIGCRKESEQKGEQSRNQPSLRTPSTPPPPAPAEPGAGEPQPGEGP